MVEEVHGADIPVIPDARNYTQELEDLAASPEKGEISNELSLQALVEAMATELSARTGDDASAIEQRLRGGQLRPDVAAWLKGFSAALDTGVLDGANGNRAQMPTFVEPGQPVKHDMLTYTGGKGKPQGQVPKTTPAPNLGHLAGGKSRGK